MIGTNKIGTIKMITDFYTASTMLALCGGECKINVKLIENHVKGKSQEMDLKRVVILICFYKRFMYIKIVAE